MRPYSPCVGICSATALGDEICRGCGRTFDEVINWNQLTDEQRSAVWERLNERVSRQSIERNAS